MRTSRRWTALGLLGWLLLLATASAAGEEGLNLPLWSIAPFVLLLLGVAVLPLVAGHWWHRNRNKGYVAAALAIPTALYLAILQIATGQHALEPVGEKLLEYVAFIVMLGSLYTVSGGIVLRGDLPAQPATNTALLGIGAILANLIGTTGASMLLIRPLLRINAGRTHRTHLPIFFIFVVSNVGGLLTPLGDPPLFLGFLEGVPFAWTLKLWPLWVVVNLGVLTVFFVWDTLAVRRELRASAPVHRPLLPGNIPREPLRIDGLVNVLFLAGIVAAVLLQGVMTGVLREIVPAVLMLAMALLSLRTTPAALRAANSFTWEPIVEVAVLFAGIFVTMVPALAILEARGGELGLTRPWQFFWLTGVLSGFLDNAPTYLTFATLAAGQHPIGWLAGNEPQVLAAISSGAVFMGALTYIGNGPNFMVKAIAEQAGYRMPSFFGYLVYSCLVLLPILLLVTSLFFLPA